MQTDKQEIDSEEDNEQTGALSQQFTESLVISNNRSKVIIQNPYVMSYTGLKSEQNESVESEVSYSYTLPSKFVYRTGIKTEKLQSQLSGKNTDISSIDVFIDIHKLPHGSIINLDRELGSGAFGKVFLGKWGERLVALKKIDIYHAQKFLDITEGEAKEALQWEISRLATTAHSNLVQFYGIYKQELTNIIVMEYCESGSLQEVLKTQTIDWSTKWQWALEITQGLSYLHKEGIIHRDLKAGNILLDHNNRAKLGDLGVAQVDALLQRKEAGIVVKGLQDQNFIAPEIYLQGPEATAIKSDVYALGLVFWQLTTNSKKEPQHFSKLSLSAIHDKPWEHEQIPEDCPVEFRKLILECWRLNPDERPNTNLIVEKLYEIAPRVHSIQDKLHSFLNWDKWIKLCEELDEEINFIRKESYRYILSYVTQHQIFENLVDIFWQKLEYQFEDRLEEALESGVFEDLADIWQTAEEYQIKDSLAEFKGKLAETLGLDSNNIGNVIPLRLNKVLSAFLETTGSSTLLLLGESGVGKTLSIYREADLLLSKWWPYLKSPDSHIPYFPIFIRSKLDNWSHYELRDSIKKIFKHYQLDEPLAKTMNWLVIVDGYDECQGNTDPQNLSELIGLKDLPNTKLLVTCRSNTFENIELEGRFAFNGKLIKRHFLPFSITQMFNYLKRVLNWNVDTHEYYYKSLQKSKGLRMILRNPLVLSLLAQSWETVSKRDFTKLNRWQIYQNFIEHWINTQYKLLSPNVQKYLTKGLSSMLDSFDNFASEVAFSAFQQESIVLKPDIQKLTTNSQNWINLHALVIEDCKKQFAIRKQQLVIKKEHRALLSEQDYIGIMEHYFSQFIVKLPLQKKTALYEFTHKSFFEYFVAKRIIALKKEDNPQAIIKEGIRLLNCRSIQSEPEVLNFIAEAWHEPNTTILKESFLQIIECSKCNKDISQASANAITILNSVRVLFSGINFKEINIPGADLSYGIFDGTNFFGANLSNVNFKSAWLASTNFQNAIMHNVTFGEKSYIKLEEMVIAVCYSKITIEGCLIKEQYLAATCGSLIVLYDACSLKKIKVLEGHNNKEIRGIVFSGCGTYLASISVNHEIYLWNLKTWACKKIFEVGAICIPYLAGVNSVSLSFDGKYLAYGNLCKIYIWHLETDFLEKKTLSQPKVSGEDENKICSISFSPKGEYLASGSYSCIYLWNLKTDNIERVFVGHNKHIFSISFSPNEEYLVSGGYDNSMRIWNLKTGIQEVFGGHWDSINCVSFSPNGEYLASGSEDRTIQIWRLQTRTLEKTLSGHHGPVNSISFSPNGKHLVSGSVDRTVRFWELQTQVLKNFFVGHDNSVCSVSFSPNGEYLASGSEDRTICLWKLKTGTLEKSFNAHTDIVYSVSFSPDGDYLASGSGGGDQTVRLWNVSSGTLEITFDISNIVKYPNFAYSISFSPNGEYLASGCHDGVVRLWSLKTRVLEKMFKGHKDAVGSVFFSPNGEYLASSSADRTVRLWNLKKDSLEAIFESHSWSVQCLFVSSNNEYLVSGSKDCTLCLWNLKTHTLEKTFEGHSDHVWSLAISPDCQWLASGSRDLTIKIWLLKSTLKDFIVNCLVNFAVCSLTWKSFSHGEYIASSGSDNSVRLWKPVLGCSNPLLTLYWSTSQTILCASCADLTNSKGLSLNNIALLKQYGALGEPATQTLLMNDDDNASNKSQSTGDYTENFVEKHAAGLEQYGIDTDSSSNELIVTQNKTASPILPLYNNSSSYSSSTSNLSLSSSCDRNTSLKSISTSSAILTPRP